MDAHKKKMLLYGGGAVAVGVVLVVILRNQKAGQSSGNPQTYLAQLGPNLSGAGSSFQPGGGGSSVDDTATQPPGPTPIPEPKPGGLPGWVGGWGGGLGIGTGPGPQGGPPPNPNPKPAPLPIGGGRILPILPPGLDGGRLGPQSSGGAPDVMPIAFGGGAPVGGTMTVNSLRDNNSGLGRSASGGDIRTR